MNTENSNIRITAYTDDKSPIYFVQGSINKGTLEAHVKDDNREVARLHGHITKLGYFYCRMEFNYCKHNYLDLFGRLGNNLFISEGKLDDKDQAFLASGIFDEHVVAEFTLMNLDGVISFLITGEVK